MWLGVNYTVETGSIKNECKKSTDTFQNNVIDALHSQNELSNDMTYHK